MIYAIILPHTCMAVRYSVNQKENELVSPGRTTEEPCIHIGYEEIPLQTESGRLQITRLSWRGPCCCGDPVLL